MRRLSLLIALFVSLTLNTHAQQCDSTYMQKPVSPERLTDPTDEQLSELWSEGNQAYVSGDYSEAIEKYTEIVENGRYSVKLYNNLGSAYFNAGQTGKSILYLRRALRLAPSNEDVRFNLRLAESRTKDKIAEVPEFFLVRFNRSVRNLMGCTAWSIVSLLMLLAAVTCILFFFLSSVLVTRKIGFYGFVLTFILFIVSFVFARSSGHDATDMDVAVVTSSAISVKATPDRSAKDLFVLHEGTVVDIHNTVEEWCEIAIADGKKGWVESRSIEVI